MDSNLRCLLFSMAAIEADCLQMKPSVQCALCVHTFSHPRSLPCLHVFCETCLDQHMQKSTEKTQFSCPLCRTTIRLSSDGLQGFPLAFFHYSQVDMYHRMLRLHSQLDSKSRTIKQLNEVESGHYQKLVICFRHIYDASSATGHDLQLFSHLTYIRMNGTTYPVPCAKISKSGKRYLKNSCATNNCYSNTSNASEDVDLSSHMALLRTPEKLLHGSAELVRRKMKDVSNWNHSKEFANVLHQDISTEDNQNKPHTAALCDEMNVMMENNLIIVRCPPVRAHHLRARKVQEFSVEFYPCGISCTLDGDVIVCQYNGSLVRVFSHYGNKIRDMRTPDVTRACDVAYSKEYIYVTCKGTNTVLVFTLRGNLVKSIALDDTDTVSGLSVHNNVAYISAAASSALYKAEIVDGLELCTLRTFAPHLRLKRPLCLCVRGDRVAVTSYDDHCVHVTDLQGTLLYTHGTPGQPGLCPERMHYPWGVTLDQQGRVLVADTLNNRICVVSAGGGYLGEIDLMQGKLKDPMAITVNPQGQLVVACTPQRGPHRIVTYEYNFTL